MYNQRLLPDLRLEVVLELRELKDHKQGLRLVSLTRLSVKFRLSDRYNGCFEFTCTNSFNFGSNRSFVHFAFVLYVDQELSLLKRKLKVTTPLGEQILEIPCSKMVSFRLKALY